MKLTDFIKRLFWNYFIIFAIIIIVITVLRQIFLPDSYIAIKDMYIYMVCALAADLASFVIYSPGKIPEREFRTRVIIHFAALEAILLILANITGWISGIENTVSLAVEVAIIYAVIRFILWISDRKSALIINGKLKAMKDDPQDGTEED